MKHEETGKNWEKLKETVRKQKETGRKGKRRGKNRKKKEETRKTGINEGKMGKIVRNGKRQEETGRIGQS